ncbi:VOC family protein [Geodermatophilus sp. SYSU D01119]
MSCHLDALAVGAQDPAALARFWAGLLGRETVEGPGGVDVPPEEDPGLRLRFLPTALPRTGRNRMHLDLTSATPGEQAATVERALALGGRHLDVGQLPEEEHVVLADPEGNEFCVIEAGNRFLAGCGPVGAVACDGTRAAGLFWAAALGWPLVWDEGEETAVQSPRGGPKVTWGGPPLPPKTARNRLHLDLVPADGDREAEAARLGALGAVRAGTGAGGAVELTDPDGNEFRLL